MMREFKQHMDARLAMLLAAPGRKFWATSDEEGEAFVMLPFFTACAFACNCSLLVCVLCLA